MAGMMNKAPFRWVHAFLAAVSGSAIGSIGLAVLTGLHPDVQSGSYVLAAAFGFVFGLFAYLGRNQKRGVNAGQVYDDDVGNMADFNAGSANSAWGRIGHSIKTNAAALEASRRNDL